MHDSPRDRHLFRIIIKTFVKEDERRIYRPGMGSVDQAATAYDGDRDDGFTTTTEDDSGVCLFG